MGAWTQLKRIGASVLLAWPLLVGVGHAGPLSSSEPVEVSASEPRFDQSTFFSSPPPAPQHWIHLHGVWAEVTGSSRHQALLESLLDHAEEALPRLATDMGIAEGARVTIHLASSNAEFQAIQPGRAPDWADATAYPALDAIYLRAPQLRGGDPEPLEQVLDHELVHVLLGRSFAPQVPPSWLQEGMAQFYAGQYQPETVRQLAAGAMSGGMIPLDALERRFPSNPHRASLAYAESADFVAWLHGDVGKEGVRTLLREMSMGRSLQEAVRSATGRPLYVIDKEWRARFAPGTSLWWSAALSTDGIWVFTALLGMMAMFVVRRRERKRRDVIRAREEAEERVLRDIWSGEFMRNERRWAPASGPEFGG